MFFNLLINQYDLTIFGHESPFQYEVTCLKPYVLSLQRIFWWLLSPASCCTSCYKRSDIRPRKIPPWSWFHHARNTTSRQIATRPFVDLDLISISCNFICLLWGQKWMDWVTLELLGLFELLGLLGLLGLLWLSWLSGLLCLLLERLNCVILRIFESRCNTYFIIKSTTEDPMLN